MRAGGACTRLGDEVVALVSRHYLRPAVLARVDAMLAGDWGNTLTAHDMASEANWADKLRDANVGGAKLGTRQCHFVDIELSDGDENRACFGHPAMPTGGPAYPGVAQDCVVDKVGQFQAWASGTAASWAMEAFQLSKADAYGRLPPPTETREEAALDVNPA